MPRGKESKRRAREKRDHDRAQTQDLKVAQEATAEEGEATSPSYSPSCAYGPSTSSVAGTVLAPPIVPATTTALAVPSSKICDGGATCHITKSKNSSQASASTERSREDPIAKKVSMLVQFLLYKYKMNESFKKADMLKIVHKGYSSQFPEILKQASEHMDVTYGLELKEVKPSSHSYTLVSKKDDSSDKSQSTAC